MRSGNRKRESQPERLGVMKLYVHRYPQRHGQSQSVSLFGSQESHGEWPASEQRGMVSKWLTTGPGLETVVKEAKT